MKPRILLILLGNLVLLTSACSPAVPSIAIPSSLPVRTVSTVTPTPSETMVSQTQAPTFAPMDAFMKGVAYTAWDAGELAIPPSDRTLEDLIRPMGVTWIELMMVCSQETAHTPEIACDPQNDDPLRYAVRTAHELGLRVMFKPGVLVQDPKDSWSANISFGEDQGSWQKWFARYTRMITHYAALATETGADAINIGTELGGTTQREGDWRSVVAAVRAIYSGPLVYGANWGEEDRVQWWDAVDFIGVDAYYPLTQIDNPTVGELVAAWQPHAIRLEALSKKWNRPIVFTEIGYRSIDGANREPGYWRMEGKLDMQEQADCYEAVFRALWGKPWWRGVFWWNWTPNPRQGGPGDYDYTANNKPAEQILRKYYDAPPRPAPTPVPIFAEDPNTQLAIYTDGLAQGWEDWSWDAQVDWNASDTVYQGKTSIRIELEAGGALSLHSAVIDIQPYTWLEFHINIGNHVARQINLYIAGADEKVPYSYLWVQLNDPLYLDEGAFLPNRWQRIRIPLADLREVDHYLTAIAIQDGSGNGQEPFYIDEIRLLGAK